MLLVGDECENKKKIDANFCIFFLVAPFLFLFIFAANASVLSSPSSLRL